MFSSRNEICSFEHCSIVLICSICLEHRVYLFSSLFCEDNGHGMCLYVSSFFHTFTLISEEKLDNYKTPFDLAFDHSIASQLSIKHRISSLHFTLTFTDDDDHWKEQNIIESMKNKFNCKEENDDVIIHFKPFHWSFFFAQMLSSKKKKRRTKRKDQTEIKMSLVLSLFFSILFIHFHQAPDLLNDQFEVNDCLFSQFSFRRKMSVYWS